MYKYKRYHLHAKYAIIQYNRNRVTVANYDEELSSNKAAVMICGNRKR
jgi:hypothetical protein